MRDGGEAVVIQAMVQTKSDGKTWRDASKGITVPEMLLAAVPWRSYPTFKMEQRNRHGMRIGTVRPAGTEAAADVLGF